MKANFILLKSILLIVSFISISCSNSNNQVTYIPYSCGDLWGYADSKVNMVLPCKYFRAGLFKKGYARVTIMSNQKELVGIIDSTFKEIIPCQYEIDRSEDLNEAYNRISQNGFFGIINYKGETVIPIKYSQYDIIRPDPEPEFCWIYDTALEKFSLYSVKQNKVLIPPSYDKIKEMLYNTKFRTKERNFIVQKDSKLGVVSEQGKEIIPFLYDQIIRSENMFTVMKDLTVSYFNSSGKEIYPKACILNDIYDDNIWDMDFREGLGKIYTKENGYGFVDTTGKIIIAPQYYIANNFEQGVSKTKKNEEADGYTVIDKQNNILSQFSKYTEVYPFLEEGIALARIHFKYGYINKKGEEVIPFIYEDGSTLFKDPIAVKKDKLWGAINMKGEVVIPFKYKDLSDFDSNKLAKANHLDPQYDPNLPVGFDYYYIDQYGNEFRKDGFRK